MFCIIINIKYHNKGVLIWVLEGETIENIKIRCDPTPHFAFLACTATHYKSFQIF